MYVMECQLAISTAESTSTKRILSESFYELTVRYLACKCSNWVFLFLMAMAVDLSVELLFRALKLSYHLCSGASTGNKYGRIDEHEAHTQESFYELTVRYLACNLAKDRRPENNNLRHGRIKPN